jgi:hypothetical protein
LLRLNHAIELRVLLIPIRLGEDGQDDATENEGAAVAHVAAPDKVRGNRHFQTSA